MAELGAIGRTPYKDRQVGLVLFGILDCLIGLFVLLVAPLPLLALVRSELGSVLPNLIFDLLLAVAFIWLGIGSILARRWARTLMLVLSWLWLVSGVAACLVLLVVHPGPPWPAVLVLAHAIPLGALAFGPAALFVDDTLGDFLALCYVALPAILVLFYSSPNVKATCEARDHRPRWTDRCPTPVLALSLVLDAGAAGILAAAWYGALPFFGRIVSGPPAVAMDVGLASILAILGRATFRLRSWAWWRVLALALVGDVSIALAALSGRLSWGEVSGIEMAEQVKRLDYLDTPLEDTRFLVLLQIFALAGLGYLVWVKRFFRPPAIPRAEAAAGPAPAAGD
ncbi:MAG TPA: hypothetical protein VHG32_16010 [Thermoanaerobaculia bacterium]|jgi:hypothetical protein|nr:hypothetical protein [Thermoanaerobaculia bacterium]